MCLFTELLHSAWKSPRAEVNRRVSMWLSGARDRRSGPEPARKKRAVEAARARPAEPETASPERPQEASEADGVEVEVGFHEY